MATDDFRRRMEAWWSDCDSDAMARKESQSVTLKLIKIFGQMEPEDRTIADLVVGEWACSDEERKRFDALAVIAHFRIRTTIPQLRMLEGRLLCRAGPVAASELEKVRTILASLENE